MKILDHTRSCGSLDYYLLVDAFRWYIVYDTEMSEDDARQAAHEYPDEIFDTEEAALEAFAEYKES